MNKTVLITGANSRLGLAIAKKFSEKGYFVVGGSRSKPQNFSGEWKSLDLTKLDSIQDFVKSTVKKHGNIDILIHVAGVTSSSSLVNPQSSEEYENMLKVNVLGQFNLNNVVFEITETKPSRVVTITSLCGISPVPNFGIYCASKFASEAMNIVYHMDYSKIGVKFTNITPGAIKFESQKSKISHSTLRDRFKILGSLFPFVTAELIANKIINIVESNDNPPRVIMGCDAQIMNLAYRLLPLRFYVWLFQRLIR